MIHSYPPPWLKRPDSVTYRSCITGWWLSWFFVPIPYSQLLPMPFSLAAFAVAAPITLVLLYKCLSSWGRFHASKAGLAWRIGSRRGWLPWEEMLDVRVEGFYLPRLIVKHSKGEVSLPFQSVKRGSRLFLSLLKRAPSRSPVLTSHTLRRDSHWDLIVGSLLIVPIRALSGKTAWQEVMFYTVMMLLVFAGLNSPLASRDRAQRVIVDLDGIRWKNRFFGRWRRLAWGQISRAEFDLDHQEGAGMLNLSGEAGEVAISGLTAGFLEILRLTLECLPRGVRIEIKPDDSVGLAFLPRPVLSSHGANS